MSQLFSYSLSAILILNSLALNSMADSVKEPCSESMLTELSHLSPVSRGIKRKRDLSFSILSSSSSESESLSHNVLESISSSAIVDQTYKEAVWEDAFEDYDSPDDDGHGDSSVDEDGDEAEDYDDGEDDGIEEYPLEDEVDPTTHDACVDLQDGGYCDCWKHPAKYNFEPWYEPYTLAEFDSDTDSDNYKPQWLKDN